jgi:thiol-disulfide isomerase/thioredoxin
MDLDGKWVSLRDERYRDKVVIVQIMGSWCPNCMDETAFLSKYYKMHSTDGIEVVALAYEYTTEPARARKSLMKFRDRFDVRYPMLITGVTSADSLRTEKTLPELTSIKAFPTTIFVGRDGKVKHVHAGYSGPATGLHHDAFVQEFERTIQDLRNRKEH